MVHVLYRISNNSYNKVRLDNATKKNCLINAINAFNPENKDLVKFYLFGDGINEETGKEIDEIIGKNPLVTYIPIKGGSGAASFNIVLDCALTLPEEDIIYFVEDDYAWRKEGLELIIDVMNYGVDYYTSYTHPDKHIPPPKGNPEVDLDGGYLTKVYNINGNLYYMVNSTTMTFCSKVKTLKEDESILRKWTNMGDYPQDFQMFLELRDKGKILLCSLVPYSCHLEKAWLAPTPNIKNIDLEKYWNKILLDL